MALRKWHLSELKRFLRPLSQPGQAGAHSEEEALGVFEGLHDFWRDYRDDLPESGEMLPTYGDTIAQMLAEQQAWIEREEIALREETGTEK